MEYMAHSARNGIPGQAYSEHIEHVRSRAEINAKEAAYPKNGEDPYARKDSAVLVHCASCSAEWHDLGKLMKQNQAVLNGNQESVHLPVNHTDAGAAALKTYRNGNNDLAAMLVYSHHKGLPNLPEEIIRDKNAFRERDYEVRSMVDSELADLIQLHVSLTGNGLSGEGERKVCGDFSVFARMALSCLADADHTDTAEHYGNCPQKKETPFLRAKERLAKLNEHVSKLRAESERNQLRLEMFQACRDVKIEDAVSACDSPVGSGKTFAVMAHLLSQAIRRKARRVFVVLPFTNIISQSVEAYRKALVLPGEDPSEVVAELHHRADFESEEARAFSAQWRAPIIVTTAVMFFETLASNRPAGLRRLHELPGSVIFVDEAHAALPVKLLPLAWRWIQILADEWGCYWVLASGSLVEFWKIREISQTERMVPHIVSGDLHERLSSFEKNRIQYEFSKSPMDCDELIDAVNSAPGPRLIIVNTVQTAGVLAERMSRFYGDQTEVSLEERKVLHLSTGLCAVDREKMIRQVKKRLNDKERDGDWTLVATSCVEAGVDFSFHTGFRELASLLSLLQTAGRISRNGEYEDAVIWSFSLQEDPLLSSNPALVDSREVLKRLFEKSIPITPDLCTRAIISELDRGAELSEQLLSAEKKRNFSDVEAKFKVIEGDTVLAIKDEDLKERLRFGVCDWKELQRKGVSIQKSLARKMRLPCLMEGIYDWNLRYDPILGIAAGIRDTLHSSTDFLNV